MPDKFDDNEFDGESFSSESPEGDAVDPQAEGGTADGDPAAQAWLPFPVKHPGVRAPLTATQKQVLDFIYEYRAEHGVSPTLQEIGDRLKTHRVTVHAHVKALLDKKYLMRFSERASRSLIPVDELAAQEEKLQKKLRAETRESVKSDPKDTKTKSHGSREAEDSGARQHPHPSHTSGQSPDVSGTVFFPLAGKIAAGRPIEAVYDNEVLDVQALFPKERDLFVLEVVGDSMIDEQIRNGDYVICEKRSTARNGEIVVAILPTEFGSNGEATLKRFFREGKRIRLQPANRTMSPIFIEPPRQVEIRGVVVGVIRRYR